MDQEITQPYVIMNSKGLVIEKSDGFNQNIQGQLSDIILKSKSILPRDEVNTIEIVFENKSLLIKDNCANDISLSMIVGNEKK